MNKKSIYVIQKHHETHPHYDLRLEISDVLKSWAVPKKPPLKKNVKRLTIQTDDHFLNYAMFEGWFVRRVLVEGLLNCGIWEPISLRNKEKDLFSFMLKGKNSKGGIVYFD